MPNRLINETSPYLLQHAHNPVDWYPWGSDAFDHARIEDKPILLSIGYSACHWCHVMERESFENEGIAALMNEDFVSIKVDREERPDLDSIYMTAVQAMTGQGGWPMTVFLNPDGRPFYGGTYFPPEERGGLPSFPRVLQALAHAYQENRGDVLRTAQKLVDHIRQASYIVGDVEPPTIDVLHQAFKGIASQFDPLHGGTGLQPKFPQPMIYEFLIRHYLRFENPDALDMVELTLEKMAHGGIYDQVGGGFHRYSTDTYWLVPHFEKMLYDNALLARLYLHAFQITGKPLYRRVVEETLDYVAREMTDPLGGFYSAQDADSEGVEGKFFVWRPEEIIDLLGKEDGEIVIRLYGVTRTGNFEGHSILHVAESANNVARDVGIPELELMELVKRSKTTLLQARESRIHPGLDDKILTSWNGLMLRTFAEAAAVLERPDYALKANQNAKFLLSKLRKGDRLLRTYRAGKANLIGYLEDYAFLIDGLLALHETTFDLKWLREAVALGNEMVDLFWEDSDGVWYDTGHDHETLIVRPRDASDNAIPSGGSMATDVLIRLAIITGDSALDRCAAKSLRSARELMSRLPAGASHWLGALDFYLSSPKEIVFVGNPNAQATKDLVAEMYRGYLPNRVCLGVKDSGHEVSGLPLLEGRRRIDDKPTAYVCENYMCKLPVTTPSGLAQQLRP